ncbi:hypothetical protein [Candidatus Anaplasma sp. TIGMIC]|uniref:hypothetical protein n=1 Tax=Candidatus Anaplasma sp. TIGMIC TaxID=3020713 RepID=UPI00232DC95D|nr:hypothetical protein [Candidatus Anaplasma sp. TIGMIC]MDB1135303.1 hypothetical protein [Candidatus Anaplasma sp. TIGMIC]
MDVVPQLDFSLYPSQVFWFVCAFLLLYSVVRCFAVPRVEAEVRSRMVSRAGAVDASSAACGLVADILQRYQELLDGAQARAEQMVQVKMEELRATCDAAIALLDHEVDEMLKEVDSALEEMAKKELKDVLLLTEEVASMYYARIRGDMSKTKIGRLKKIVAGLYGEKL